MEYEIIFVDDASIDRTPEILRRLVRAESLSRFRAVFHGKNTGRGRAVSDGIREASGEMVGCIDIDMEVHPRYISACCDAIRQGAQVALGSRTFKFVARGLFRRFLSWGYAVLVRALLPLGKPLDTESGCKFFLRESILPMLDEVEDPGWFWDTEMMMRCRLAGLSIASVPCLYIRNPAKPSSVSIIRDGYTSLAKLIVFRGMLRRSGLLHGRGIRPHP